MEKIYKEIKKHINQSNIATFITNYDTSISKEDLIQDVYIKVYNKDIKYIHNNIKNALIDIYRKKKLRYIQKVDIDEIEQETKSFEDKVVIELSLNDLRKQDEVIYNCLYYYFINNMTYKEVSKIIGISFNGVKNKIDKGLEIIANM